MHEDTAARDALAERLIGACVGSLDLLHMYIGDRLGLYRELAAGGPMSAADLSGRCRLSERYVREWLEQQAVARILSVDASSEATDRRFSVPPGHAEVLCDEDSLSFMTPLALGVAGVARALPRVLDAFATGGGVPFEAYGEDVRRFVSRINRPMFLNLLVRDWFPKIPGLVERLGADPPARVADIGCGTGWSTIAIVSGFPRVTAVGLDLDEASIAEAHVNATAAAVAHRVRFERRDAADPSLEGKFDLICAFETIHDMCDPVRALQGMRAMRSEHATVLIADERVADVFTVDVEDGERFQWGWSALHCLPSAMSEPPAAGTGTVMRAPVLRHYAQQAGFSDVEVLPIDNDFWRFYLLKG